MMTLVLKKILFLCTLLVILLAMCGIEGIYDKGYFLPVIAVIAMLVFVCKMAIKKEDWNKIL